MKLDRHDLPVYFARTESRAGAGVPIPSRAWVKSAPPSALSNDVWSWGTRAYGHRDEVDSSGVRRSTALVESRREKATEAHPPGRLDRIDHEELLGLFLAGALLGVLAWGAMGSAPRSAAVIVAMFAGAFMAAALAGSFRRWRKPRTARVIGVTSFGELSPADAALRLTPGSDRTRGPIDAAYPIARPNETRPGVGTSRQQRARSAYDGLADA